MCGCADRVRLARVVIGAAGMGGLETDRSSFEFRLVGDSLIGECDVSDIIASIKILDLPASISNKVGRVRASISIHH